MKGHPLVSIIMPAKNAALYINRSIDSVLAQTWNDWELIIVDDASVDNTAEVAEINRDRRIVVIRSEKNLGAADARNLALERKKGRFIAFLDSDDIWLPEKLNRQLIFMKETGCKISCTDYVKIDEVDSIISPIVGGPSQITYSVLLRSNSIACSSTLIDTDFYPDLRMPDIRLNHDYALWLSLLREGGEAVRIPEPLLRYRVHTASLSHNKWESAKYNWLIYRRLEKLSRLKAAVCMINFITAGLRKYLK